MYQARPPKLRTGSAAQRQSRRWAVEIFTERPSLLIETLAPPQVFHVTADTLAGKCHMYQINSDRDMKREELKNLLDPTVELITAYKPVNRGIMHDDVHQMKPEEWAEVCAAKGGFNPFTKEFTPLKYDSEEMWMHEALDHITAALEAGIVDRNNWATQLFAGEHELEEFLTELECYDETSRIADRWWLAVAKLADWLDEDGMVNCSEIVEKLRESIETGRRRAEMRIKEAEYFAANPPKKLRLSAAQRALLSAYNVQTNQTAFRMRADKDVSVDFRFSEPFFLLKDGVLSARQATLEDVQALVAKAEKPKSKARKAA